MAALTANDVMVITDFDATITTGDSEQCHDLVGGSSLLSSEFRKEFAPLLDWTSRMAAFWESRFDDLDNLLNRMDQ